MLRKHLEELFVLPITLDEFLSCDPVLGRPVRLGSLDCPGKFVQSLRNPLWIRELDSAGLWRLGTSRRDLTLADFPVEGLVTER